MPRTEAVLQFLRRRAFELMNSGEPIPLISKFLGVGSTTLFRWRALGEARTLAPRESLGGRPRLLNRPQLLELDALLKAGASQHGWPNNIWTVRRVRHLIKRKLNLKIHYSTAWRILRKYLNWSCQRPVQRYGARDESAADRWRKNLFPELRRTASKRKAHLVFIDEAGFMLAPNIRRTFAPRGQTPIIRVSDPHARISVIGALCVSPDERRHRFVWSLLKDNRNYTSDRIVEFLEALGKRISRKSYILWDSIPIHRSGSVGAFFGRHNDLTEIRFPAYTPDLNPVDRIWFYAKYNRLANYTPLVLSDLRKRLRFEFRRIEEREGLLRSCVRYALGTGQDGGPRSTDTK
ncbi:MAG TPA: IS630 family transposase [Planctomycetota bacterium]|nr:IS630 family transposase [Planctomycetota bacterium]